MGEWLIKQLDLDLDFKLEHFTAADCCINRVWSFNKIEVQFRREKLV